MRYAGALDGTDQRRRVRADQGHDEHIARVRHQGARVAVVGVVVICAVRQDEVGAEASDTCHTPSHARDTFHTPHTRDTHVAYMTRAHAA